MSEPMLTAADLARENNLGHIDAQRLLLRIEAKPIGHVGRIKVYDQATRERFAEAAKIRHTERAARAARLAAKAEQQTAVAQ